MVAIGKSSSRKQLTTVEHPKKVESASID